MCFQVGDQAVERNAGDLLTDSSGNTAVGHGSSGCHAVSTGGHLCLHAGLALRQDLIETLGVREITGHDDLTHQIDGIGNTIIEHLRLQLQGQRKFIRILQSAIDIVHRSHAAGDQVHLIIEISIRIMLGIQQSKTTF